MRWGPRGSLLLAWAVVAASVAAFLGTSTGVTADTLPVLLPTGQRIDPAGAIVTVGRGPQDLLLTPDGNAVIVTNSGRNTQTISVVDVTDREKPAEVQHIDANPNWVGLAFVGNTLYASGGQANLLHVFHYNAATKQLERHSTIPLLFTDQFPGAAGFAVDGARDGTGQPREVVEQTSPETAYNMPSAFPLPACVFAGGIGVSHDGKHLYVACQQSGAIATVDVPSNKMSSVLPIGGFPYGIAVKGADVFVSDWSQPRVEILTDEGGSLATTMTDIRVGRHPSALAMASDGTLYVTNGNDDAVSVIKGTQLTKTISLTPYAGAPKSSIPTDLALSPDERTLYVALGGNNAVAVIDTKHPPTQPKDLRYLPAAWFPTAVQTSSDGRALYVASAKGLGSGPNPSETDFGPTQQIFGTLQVINNPEGHRGWTNIVRRDNNFDTNRVAEIPSGTAMYDAAKRHSPVIDHVLFVVRENKTFDQVLGDLSDPKDPGYRPDVRGDFNLVRYGRNNTPNTHALADRWVIADGFRAPIEESFTGHEWLNFAQLSDFSQRVWTTEDRVIGVGVTDVSLPGEGSLLNRAAEAGVGYRIYGWDGLQTSMRPENEKNFLLQTNLAYPTGLQYYTRDIDRIQPLIADIKTGSLQPFSYVWIPNDHTYDLQQGARTPQSLVADNDWAAGKIVDAISHSAYWKNTAVFFVEDDSQSGKDHIDSHRTVFVAASPWIRSRYLTHANYDFSSLHRTVELLLGLKPTSQYEDKAAEPLTEIFRNVSEGPDVQPYTAIEPSISPNELNPPLNSLNPVLRQLGSLALSVDRSNVDQDEEKTRTILDGMYRHGLWKYGPGLAPKPTKDVLRAGRKAFTVSDDAEDETGPVVLGVAVARAHHGPTRWLALALVGLAVVMSLFAARRREA
jgi:DNA-binding beta-propeller fold protein YncE